MAANRLPGPLGRPSDAIDDGTLPRTAMSRPGTVGTVEPLCYRTWGPIIVLGREHYDGAQCLLRLEDEMQRQTRRYLHEACRRGHCRTSRAGVRYIAEGSADAFGHCYIACEGTRRCGLEMTERLGIGREMFRELMAYVTLGIWGHNSYDEDVYNQDVGRRLARLFPGLDSYALTYEALRRGLLRVHPHSTAEDPNKVRVYLCEEVSADGRDYAAGWQTMPRELVTMLPY